MSRFLTVLAEIILSGPYEGPEISRRIEEAVRPLPRPVLMEEEFAGWTERLVSRLLRQFPPTQLPPLHAQLVRFLRDDEVIVPGSQLLEECIGLDFPLDQRRGFLPLRERFHDWGLPPLETCGELADWLHVSLNELDWLSGRYHRKAGGSRYETRLTRSKSGKARLLEIPHPALRRAQRIILDEILSRVAPHPAAHGFRRGGSVASNAQPHVSQAVVWKTDLSNYFLTIRSGRVLGLFRMLGYPERVARVLTGLTTHRLEHCDLDSIKSQLPQPIRLELERLGPAQHLPQGAPTSPALSNLVSWRLDTRLQGLSQKFGAVYTRYADDLAFSGGREFHQHLTKFRVWALAIISDEGFLIRSRKSRVMPASRRQQVTGVVINSRLNTPRDEYKQLHAILHKLCGTRAGITELELPPRLSAASAWPDRLDGTTQSIAGQKAAGNAGKSTESDLI